MPLEYLQLFLCRDVYHCTPPQLDEVPLPRILQDLTVLNIEAEMHKAKADLNAKK
jgi:hypothetical protein